MLVGVDHYKRLTKLQYCGDDMRALGPRLVDSGFHKDQVVALQDQAKGVDLQPLKLNIVEQLKLILGSATEQDLVLLAFSGHGIRIGGRSYPLPSHLGRVRLGSRGSAAWSGG